MNLLAIDTATEACTVALRCGEQVFERFEHMPQQQANLILPMIDEVMAEAGLAVSQLTAVAFGRGPGSFTGLRVAAGVAQGIAFAADLPVLPISTLAVIAQTASRCHQQANVLATIDARMNEIYWGEYQLSHQGLMEPVSKDRVSSAGAVELSSNCFGVGSGFRAFGAELSSTIGAKLSGQDDTLWPQAVDMLLLAANDYHLGKAVASDQAVPVYLRDDVAKKKSSLR